MSFVTHRALLGNVNYFGGQGNVCAKNVLKLQQAEQENQESMFVVMSDVWLDKIKVRVNVYLLVYPFLVLTFFK